MTDIEKVCIVLYKGLVDIRFASYEKNFETVFRLADLLHNVPLSISEKVLSDGEFKEIFDGLLNRADGKGLLPWVERALNEK